MNTIVIPGHVVPKARPRFNRATGTAYTDPKYRDYLKMAAQVIAIEHRGAPLEGPLYVKTRFDADGVTVTYRPSLFTPTWSARRADIDNLAGSILDALQQGGAIVNDKDVVSLAAVIE